MCFKDILDAFDVYVTPCKLLYHNNNDKRYGWEPDVDYYKDHGAGQGAYFLTPSGVFKYLRTIMNLRPSHHDLAQHLMVAILDSALYDMNLNNDTTEERRIITRSFSLRPRQKNNKTRPMNTRSHVTKKPQTLSQDGLTLSKRYLSSLNKVARLLERAAEQTQTQGSEDNNTRMHKEEPKPTSSSAASTTPSTSCTNGLKDPVFATVMFSFSSFDSDNVFK